MKGLILACGSGSRLAPFTDNTSKAMVPYMNHNAFYYQCLMFKKWGINQIVVFYDKGNESDFNISIKDLDVELEIYHLQKGWDNTWKKAAELFKNETVVIVNCDILISQKYRKVIEEHIQNKSDLSLACSSNEYNHYGQLAQLLYIREKSGDIIFHTHIYTKNTSVVREIGMSVVKGHVWHLIDDMAFDSIDPWRDSLIPLVIEKKFKVQCVRVNAACQDLGTWKGLKTAYTYPIEEYKDLVQKQGNNIIEDSSIVESLSDLNYVVVMKNSKLKAGVKIENAIILPNSVIANANDKKIIYIKE